MEGKGVAVSESGYKNNASPPFAESVAIRSQLSGCKRVGFGAWQSGCGSLYSDNIKSFF